MKHIKRAISILMAALLALCSFPIYSYADSNEFEVFDGAAMAIVDNCEVVEVLDIDPPDDYGDSYGDAYAYEVLLSDIDSDGIVNFTLEFPDVYLNNKFGQFPKVSTVGYRFDEMEEEADEDTSYYVSAEIVQRICDTSSYEYNIRLVDGKAQIALFFYYPEDVHEEDIDGEPTNICDGPPWTTGRVPDVVVINFSLNDVEPLVSVTPSKGQIDVERGLFKGDRMAYLVLPYNLETTEADLKFTNPNFFISVNGGELLNPDNDGVLNVILKAAQTDDSITGGFENVIKVYEDEELLETYKIIGVNQRYEDLPDSVVDYLCVGSQYTNRLEEAQYGLRSVRSLVGSNFDAGGVLSGPVSLGNFGGYIIYYYRDPIIDDPNNPYGIDFITFGNSVEGSDEFAEPGQVWVSEDAVDWYALGGGMHYEDFADWNYSITYEKTEDGYTSWTDSNGDTALLDQYEYPNAKLYPLHEFIGDSITLNGIAFEPSAGTNEYGNARPPFSGFGYTDMGQKGIDNPENNIAGNPYLGTTLRMGRETSDVTDGMDLAWAVDTEGQPINVSDMRIHYIKIVTASNINNSAIGEKSTEVNMVRVARANDSAVGISTAPKEITFDGQKVNFTSGAAISENVFRFDDIAVDGEFEVNVDAEDSNVYINNNCSATAEYDKIPDHGIIRVIVQDGEKEPLIYVFNLREMTEDEKAAKAVDELIKAIGDPEEVTLESAAAIKAARDAYEALDDAAKAKVEKLNTLTAAEAKLKELQDAASKEEADAAAAKGVSEAITALGDDISLDDEKAVESARAAYNALTDDQKALVTNEDALKAAEAKIAQLKEDTPMAQEVEKQIAAIGEVTKYKETEIQAAREAYDALTDSQKALVGNLAALEAAEAALEDLKNGSGSDDTIQVTFRLIGSTIATEDVDLSKGEEGYYTAEYQNWIKTRTYTMHSDDSVYDLFVKATGDAGIESKGANKGYVSSIKAPDSLGGYWLSEFTNGKYSGWMYTMDGKHTDAIKDQKLKDGADVIFHYVNDYRYEVEDWFDEPAYPSLATDDTFYSRWLEAADVRPGSQGGGGTTPAEEPEVVDPVDTPEDPNGGATVGRFIDVDEDDWFAEAVDYAVENGFMVGTGEDTFSPQKTLTRGMLASMLYSMEGAPAEDGTTDFTDVDPSDWFAKGVEWAVENGVAAGYGERFGPNDDITREQMVVMLYGYAKMKGYELVEGEDLSGYEDAGEISSWALPAMQWAKAAGLVSGRSATKMAPLGTTTRAEAATIMRNFLENVAK